ncbi:hypothetical protein PBY51_009583 [Eleginops maclovinus]|uniref:Uncharacterized protein n=1 Tax=Eleginops maclovinus TaxID=56733 RepID=A0AAN8AV69_ELEMC|nr:hypothetical protein PBY51_009583 [Eleginops maclovinus]
MVRSCYKSVLGSGHAGLHCCSKSSRLRHSPKHMLSKALKCFSAACDAAASEDREAGELRKNAKPARCMAPRSSGKTAPRCNTEQHQ